MRRACSAPLAAVYVSALILLSVCCAWGNTIRLIVDAGIPPASELTAEQQDRQAYNDLLKQVGDLVKTNPQAALDQYSKFFAEHPQLSESVAVDLASVIANLYYQGLKDPDKSIQAFDWAIQKYADYPPSVHLIMDKANVLVGEKREDEAIALYQKNLQRILHAWPQYAMDPLDQYTRLLEKDGKDDEVAETLKTALTEIPAYMDPDPPNWDWMYNRLIDALFRKKHVEGALRWAKMRFMVCRFDPDRIMLASRLLARVWRQARPQANEEWDDFAAAQQNPAIQNPLKDVPLPGLDEKLVKQQLGSWDGPNRISLLIITDRLVEAMQEARKLLGHKETFTEGSLQVCRVFKAADLNLLRANAYLKHLKTGEGEDPVQQFLGGTAPR